MSKNLKKKKSLTPYERVGLRLRAEVERGERRSALILCVCALTLLITASVLLFSAAIAERSASRGYVYEFGGVEQTLKRELIFSGGVQYVDLYALSDAYGIEHASVLTSRASFRSGGTELIIYNGSTVASVNGNDVSLSGEARIIDTYCLIPVCDVEGIFHRADVIIGDDKTQIDLPRGAIFMIAKDIKIEYETDVSEYLGYISSTDEYIFTLANKQNPVGRDEPTGLVKIPSEYCAPGRSFYLYSVAEGALEAMMNDMLSLGYDDVYVTSAYRSYEYQENLFTGYIKEEMAKKPSLSYSEAREIVLGYSSEPGKSEHQMGLCVDFTTDSIGGVVDDVFESTAVFLWLRDNSWKYGFIMRYPSDKVDITGYDYESWHYRFVGLEVASVMHQLGICYEEYLENFNN